VCVCESLCERLCVGVLCEGVSERECVGEYVRESVIVCERKSVSEGVYV
jgi:hypothetical protein